MLKVQFSLKNRSDGNMIVNAVHELTDLLPSGAIVIKPGEESSFFEYPGLRFVIAFEVDINREAKEQRERRVRELGERAVIAEERRHRKRTEKLHA